MNLFGRQSSRAEDRFEAWLKRMHQERVLSGETQPVGPCPDEAFLRGVARRSKKIALSDPRIDHAANCPNCMNRLLAVQQNIRSERKKLGFGVATACLVFFIGVTAWFQHESHHRQRAAIAVAISTTVDLWNTGSYRGEQPGQLQSVVLPAAPVRLTIILPRFSSPGQYLVAVTRDRTGNGIIAQGFASASVSSGRAKVSVDLDLRNARVGAYFLSTTYEQSQAAYYYPLQVK
jgi:hypothetical protein